MDSLALLASRQLLMVGVIVWREELGGLGSSHTTPFRAAVPARPPTRSSHTKGRVCAPQWATGATKRGTRVVVLAPYAVTSS